MMMMAITLGVETYRTVNRYLANNILTGRIPEEFGELRSLDVIDLSTNQLSGPIPSTLGELSNLANMCVSLCLVAPTGANRILEHPGI